MPLRFLARPRTNFLFPKRLNNVDASVPPQRSFYEVIEPGFGQLPVSLVSTDPLRCGPPAILQPESIVIGERQSNSDLLTASGSTKDNRDALLIPNIIKCEPVHAVDPLISILAHILI